MGIIIIIAILIGYSIIKLKENSVERWTANKSREHIKNRKWGDK